MVIFFLGKSKQIWWKIVIPARTYSRRGGGNMHSDNTNPIFQTLINHWSFSCMFSTTAKKNLPISNRCQGSFSSTKLFTNLSYGKLPKIEKALSLSILESFAKFGLRKNSRSIWDRCNDFSKNLLFKKKLTLNFLLFLKNILFTFSQY